ncbi:MAG: hypothetical protein HYV33_00445 [Candidatus Kerfeldbacteria bacterium]|nr:hypothetical protein [Candidatus Kerfeldbacteria bacterium]
MSSHQLTAIVFFGTGPVAAASLEQLAHDFTIEAVVTKPSPHHYHGVTPVLTLAENNHWPVFTPSTTAELEQLCGHSHWHSLCAVVVDYGILLNQTIIQAFPRGAINSHFSLLPQWRGADPITFAILSGQKTTGVSIMLIEETLDTGQLLAQQEFTISQQCTAPQLTTALTTISTTLLKKIIPRYLAGTIQPYPQPINSAVSYSRKLTKADGLMDWHKPAEVIEREVRAFMGWPKSYGVVHHKNIIVTKARVVSQPTAASLTIQCQPGWLEIIELIGPSGKTMSGADFLRGLRYT